MGLKVAVCGVGQFGSQFVSLFQRHPDVDEVYLADNITRRLADKAAEFGVKRTFPGLDELCSSDCDCIAIFTQRWMHGPQAVKALKAGKHVYSAVPAAITIEELYELVETVKSTGLIYMLGETSYYRAQTTFCRELFSKGRFGKFVYGEGQYHHDMSDFYKAYMHSGGESWREIASFPPMLYPTHSTAFILGVTFQKMTEVSCMGFADKHPDGIFDKKLSNWDNVFSNQTALFRTSDGGMARINEFRRTGAGQGRMSLFGTEGAYEEQPSPENLDALKCVLSYLDIPENYGMSGNIPYAEAGKLLKLKMLDVSHISELEGVKITSENLGNLPRDYMGKTFHGISKVQPYHQLPLEFSEVKNGHGGTHFFLVNDFIRSVKEDKLPQNNVWMAARYNAPGIIAHESSKRNGELLKIPDFGTPADQRNRLDERFALNSG